MNILIRKSQESKWEQIEAIMAENEGLRKIVDKSDGQDTFYSDDVEGFGMWAEKENGENYLIQVYTPSRIENDNRKALLRVWHYIPTGDKDMNCHKIDFVTDLKTDSRKHPFHLNLSGMSEKMLKQGTCSTCQKYFLPSPMNHFQIDAKSGIGNGPPYKIIDWDQTVQNFVDKLETLGFFKEFSSTSKHRIYS